MKRTELWFCVPFLLAGVSAHVQLGLPQAIPPQYNTLKDCSPDVLSVRLRVLYHFSDLMYKSWRLLNLDSKNPVCLISFLFKHIFTSAAWLFHCNASFLFHSLFSPFFSGFHFTLQFRDCSHHPRWTPRASITQGQHSSSCALNRQNNDPGQDIWATNHCETHFHKVKMMAKNKYLQETK